MKSDRLICSYVEFTGTPKLIEAKIQKLLNDLYDKDAYITHSKIFPLVAEGKNHKVTYYVLYKLKNI